MMLLALLLQVAAPQTAEPDIVVTGPGRANALTPATFVVEPAAMFIVACDDDHDGRTTRAEMRGCLARSLAIGDTASVGYIGYSDWAAKWLGDQNALPSPFEVDRDGDNRITLAEVQTQFSRLFSRYDRSDDDAVTRAEALTIRAIAADDKGPVGGRASPRGKRPPVKGERVPRGQPDAAPSAPAPQ